MWAAEIGPDAEAAALSAPQVPAVASLTDWYGSPEAWQATGTYHVVETDVGPEVAAEAARHLDALYVEWCGYWGRTPAPMPALRAYVFAQRGAYLRGAEEAGVAAARAGGTRGLCIGSVRTILVKADVAGVRAALARYPLALLGSIPTWQRRHQERLQTVEAESLARALRTLRHEAVHAYLVRERDLGGDRPPYPLWLHEGLAAYFSASPEQISMGGGVHQQHVARLRSVLTFGEPIPLVDLLTAPDSHAFRGRFPQAHYWGLVYYLEHTGHIRTRGGWEQFAGAHSQRSRQVLEQVLELPLAEFERRWQTYFRGPHS